MCSESTVALGHPRLMKCILALVCIIVGLLMVARVYSYMRFSDPRQSSGDSASRQMDYARRWAAEHGLVLDDALTMRDEGLSAYHQRHVSRGALGVFLAAVDDGRISPGSVLIVEGLDRLSRAEPIQAQAQLAQIINAGITVVTASDGREYNRESLKAQPMDLVYSLLVMIRAHEESDTKSKRVRAAVRRQCEGWLAGTYRGLIRNGRDPQWLRLEGDTWVEIPERVAAVRDAVRMFLAGMGGTRVARELNARGLQVADGPVSGPNLYRLVRLPALVGIKRIETGGEAYQLANYYPAILSQAEFQALQVAVGKRERRRGQGEFPGIVTGIGVAVCGYCGAGVVGQNLLARKRQANGLPQPGHRRLMCSCSSRGGGCPVGGSTQAGAVELALLDYCSDQLNLSALLDGGDQGERLRADLATARAAIAEAQTKLERVIEALLEDTGAAPMAFARKARDLEDAIAGHERDIARIEAELARLARADTPALAEAWAELREGCLALEEAPRLKVRQMVADTFERIVICHHGFEPNEWDGKTVDLLLVAKSGATRALSVDRKTGAWRSAVDWDQETLGG